jgi:hypothetical protein
MPPLEKYVEHADELAQEVVNSWGANATAGNTASLSSDFMALFNKACLYRDARKIAQNRREFHILTESEAVEEISARQAFAEAYKAFREKQEAAA